MTATPRRSAAIWAVVRVVTSRLTKTVWPADGVVPAAVRRARARLRSRSLRTKYLPAGDGSAWCSRREDDAESIYAGFVVSTVFSARARFEPRSSTLFMIL